MCTSVLGMKFTCGNKTGQPKVEKSAQTTFRFSSVSFWSPTLTLLLFHLLSSIYIGKVKRKTTDKVLLKATVALLALATFGNATQMGLILFVSYCPMKLRQTQSLSLSGAFWRQFCVQLCQWKYCLKDEGAAVTCIFLLQNVNKDQFIFCWLIDEIVLPFIQIRITNIHCLFSFLYHIKMHYASL